jgi:hypothetical protein
MQQYLKLLFIFLAMILSRGYGSGQNLPPGWNYTITPIFHVIAITLSAQPAINDLPISPGDYIGVFFIRNDSLICGGAVEWAGDINVAVVAYGDDFLTTIKDGFNSGETLNWKIYSWQYLQDFDAIAEYDQSLPNYDGTFVSSGLSSLTSLNASVALLVVATAIPPVICIVSSSQLHADAIGGSGIYTYLWSSLPEGFSSSEQNPIVYPVDTTLYIVEVNDGQFTQTDTVQVSVLLPPTVFAGNDTTICQDALLPLSGYAMYYSSVHWTSGGDGQFGNDTLLSTDYTPGENDISTGFVQLMLTAYALLPCQDSAFDHIHLYFSPLPAVNAGNDDTICEGAQFTTMGFTTNASYIIWTTSGDGTFDDPTSTGAVYTPGQTDIITGSVILSLTAYSIPPCNTDTTDQMNLIIQVYPDADAGQDVYIPYGTNTQLSGNATGGSGEYSFYWIPEEALIDPSVQNPITINLTETTVFTLTVTDLFTGCQDQDEVIVYITGGPLSVRALAHPGAVCEGDSSQLEAIPSGGSGNYNYFWTSIPPGFYSSQPAPVVYPDQTTLYIINISDGFATAGDSIMVIVNTSPIADAGADITIPYGTSTVLHSTASGGSGNYEFMWAPAFYLVDPEVQNPATINLFESVEFIVSVSDVLFGCSDTDSVNVYVEGDALQVTVTADPDKICLGDTAQLHAYASGGSGEYVYTWSSFPPGFYSSDPEPQVTPEITTNYFVQVSDGYNTVIGSVKVTVHSIPGVQIISFPDDTVCQNEFIMLDATTPGAVSYLWSPGGYTDPVIWVDTTGTGIGSAMLSVTITDYNGCLGTDSITITFNDCVGMPEIINDEAVTIYPNPAENKIYVSVKGLPSFDLAVTNMYGMMIMEKHCSNANNGIIIPVEIDHLADGIYLIKIQSVNYRNCKKLMIK